MFNSVKIWRVLLATAFAVIFGVACAGSSSTNEAVEDIAASSPDLLAPPATDLTPTEMVTDELAPQEPTSAAQETPQAEPTAAGTPTPTAAPVSYNGSFSSSIQPILEEKCASCHYDGGPGAFHWNLRTAQDIADTHLLVHDVITANTMPPWPASDLSVMFQGDRSLRPDQVQAYLDWVEDGAPLDVEPSTLIEPSTGLVRLANPDIVVEAVEPYAGDASKQDDHRCLIYDPMFDDGTWITGYEFIPDQTPVVHHAVGFLMPASARQEVDARDGADGRPGWSCAGAVGLDQGTLLLGWAPGQAPTIFSDGTGQWVEPNSFIVVQVHYHFDGDAPLDNSTLALTLERPDTELEPVRVQTAYAPVEIPCASWESGPLCDRDAAMADATDRFGPRGVISHAVNSACGVTAADFENFTDGIAESSCTWTMLHTGGGGTVESILLHMHEIGAWTRLTLNKGTPDEQILVDIDQWDFDWQYNYVPLEPLVIDDLDKITLECAWDRSLSPDLEPAWILWAEGTNDEMCISYMIMR